MGSDSLTGATGGCDSTNGIIIRSYAVVPKVFQCRSDTFGD
jgi:hypothetical protein